MKHLKSILCFLLVITFSLAVFAVTACKKKGDSASESEPASESQSENTGDSAKDDDYTPDKPYTGGIHNVSIKQGDAQFIKNGTCDWQIIIGKSVSAKIETAALELVKIFREATGATLSVVKSDDVGYSATSRFISLGENGYTKSAGITKPADIKANGYVIKTEGNSIFVVGGKDLGTLFGVYGLLNGMFGYEYYYQDPSGNECYYVDKNVKEKNLPLFDVYENPDFDHAISSYDPMYQGAEAAHKMRMESLNEVYMTSTGIKYVHNTLDYLPKGRYQAAHPDWYSIDGRQLCYTARGNKAERDALIEELSRVMIQVIKERPDSEIITLTQMDDSFWCECDTCRAMKAEYGTDSASCIKLTNEVADKIEAWRKTEAPERKITVVMFAYTSTETPPAYKDENGKWQAKDESVKLRDNVCLLFAPIYSMSYNHNVEDDVNEKTREQLEGWEACADHVSVWSYSAMFYNYFMPYDTYSTCRNQYKRWLESGALWIFDNAQYDTKAPLGFSTLKAYLNSAWSWNVNRSYNELVDGFFENYFGSKDGSMRKFFDELRVWLKSRDEAGVKGLTGTSHAEWDSAENWSKPLLDRWVKYCEEAKAEIAGLKTSDPAKYNIMLNRIDLEAMMPRYMLLEFYPSYFSAEELIAERKSFAADARRLGVTKFGENRDIEILIRDW